MRQEVITLTERSEESKGSYWHTAYLEELERKREWKAIAVNREGEHHALVAALEVMKAERNRYEAQAGSARAKLEAIEETLRAYLDECDYEEDTTDLRELRGYVWNASETEAKIRAERYKP